MRTPLWTAALLAACSYAPVKKEEVRPAPEAHAAVLEVEAEPVTKPEPGPVRMERLDMPDDLPAWALLGGRPAGARMRVVFVPGMCVHPLGYAQSFQHAAAARGELVTLQGDVSCGGDGTYRRWSNDLVAMSRRIDAVVRAADIDVEASGVTLVGYSQGAERAERLAARFPEKYARLVLIASPVVPSPERLGRAKAVVLMAGTRDPWNKQNMIEGEKRLARAGVPVRYLDLPGAAHGGMGEDPEKVMGEALDFIEEMAPLEEDR